MNDDFIDGLRSRLVSRVDTVLETALVEPLGKPTLPYTKIAETASKNS
jgi:hypothetical protein